MQIKIFTIPILGGEEKTDQMNVFLRSKRILQVESQFINSDQQGLFWSFCVRYLDDLPKSSKTKQRKIDYKEILSEEAFQRFSLFREIRKKLSKEEGIPAYAVFTDAELAELAKIEELNAKNMQEVKGVGKKKVERYAVHFIPKDEKDQKTD